MAFCSNCGQKLEDGAKFCFECGTPVRTGQTVSQSERKITYDGEIHKCPNCGEVLESFVVNCPSCGYELRGAQSASSIEDFSAKMEKATSDAQKVALIRNFPIANTKEDIFEFMILASSSITGEYNEAVFNAWLAKFEQCYQKAKLAFGNDSDFLKIQDLYGKTTKQVSKERVAHGANKFGLAVSKFTSTFPNPIFGIVVVLLGIYEIIRIVKGDFAGLDIIMSALILWGVYRITNKKGKKSEDN